MGVSWSEKKAFRLNMSTFQFSIHFAVPKLILKQFKVSRGSCDQSRLTMRQTWAKNKQLIFYLT